MRSVWRAIRRGEQTPYSPFVSLGRVLVSCTVIGVLYAFGVNSVAVAVLLFFYYIPDDVFGERVLGM